MDSTKYVGRVGTLAIALGIGAALTFGNGIAWAEGADGGTGGGGGSTSGGTSEGGGATAKSTPDRPNSLSKIADRVRKQVKSSVNDAVSDAKANLERVQSRLEKTKTDLDGQRSSLPDKVAGQAANEGSAVSLPAVRDRLNRTTRRQADVDTAVASPQPVSKAASTPNLAKPADSLQQAVRGAVERGQQSISAVRDAAAPALTLTSAPISSFIEKAPRIDLASSTTQAGGLGASEVPQLVSGLLAAAGLPLSGSLPGAPGGQSPAAWVLAAFTRRESEKEVNPDGLELRSVNDAVSPMAANGEVVPMAAAVRATSADEWEQYPGQTPAPVISGSTSSTQTGWTTGNGSGTGVTDKWFVGGTDLGIMWVSGYTDSSGKPIVYSLFGDTYDVADPSSNIGWRDNVLLRASDFNLNDGLQFSDAVINAGAQYPGDPNGTPTWWRPLSAGQRAGAMQVISPDAIDRSLRTTTYTLIPTAAIAVPDARDENGDPVVGADGQPVMTQYATVMSIKQWGQAGSWTTNWSAIAVSEDGGKTWTIDPSTVRTSTGGNANFQQNAMMYGNPDDLNSYVNGNKTGERYVYVYGTPAGRQGSAYVARVPESQITDLNAYQYYAGDNSDGTGKWVAGQPSQAVAVISSEGSTGSIFPETGIIGAILSPFVAFLKFIYPAGFKPGGIFSAGGSSGNVSEMSVQYNEYLDKYVVTYTDGGNNVVMRVSDSPQGTWSNSTVLQANQGTGQNTGMYAPMIHPLSGTDQLGDGNQKYLYYNLSQWNDYNVRMMRADLSKLTIT